MSIKKIKALFGWLAYLLKFWKLRLQLMIVREAIRTKEAYKTAQVIEETNKICYHAVKIHHKSYLIV